MLRTGLILAFLLLSLTADQFVLITHKNSTINALSQKEIQDIYLKKRRFYHSMKLVPLNLPSDHYLRQNFESETLQMNREQLQTYWVRQHYLGHRPPHMLKSIESVLLFVQEVEGAIGYIPEDRLNEHIKVIYQVKE